MIKNFEYKISRNLQESFEIVRMSGSKIPGWKLVGADRKLGVIEWRQSFWSVLGYSKIRVYLKEPRENYTLLTIYIKRPLQIIDPAKMFQRVYKKLVNAIENKLTNG